MEIKELLIEYAADNALTADGFDNAVIGLSYDGLFVYDIDDCVSILVEDGMSLLEAEEFMDFNVLNCYMGEGTPLFIYQKK
tara:strand:+ start:8878 stop:9120 length:243 start_codon:yes stop_codon:yes gene_type:complete